MASGTKLPKVGARADTVLRMPGRSEDHAVKNPFVAGEDERGLVVEWYYADCTVELRHDGTCYRVAEVREMESVTGG